mmetsp:Transcript_551/g.1122  ORF Transcript_551/g.1122 Transcript_551/m.1122 type:complete len:161 (+) Transcript_551:25-507(+)|eukprot:CAMPEP_0119071832 /NCGR_PEP_ID=MMETSP1178-20130426/54769_1 /TAXON_ID=33656 /ORGANISM="unid sp, Strain CCMP2000" /LENGTH=160 /DNA_ID=CAMNT_0007053795 /DNA_START=25 /DNA_END=507 /DNA_ORIENTATION=+
MTTNVLKEPTIGPNFKSRTNSSRGYYKRNGELIAIAHPKPGPSNHASMNEGSGGILQSTMKESFRDPNLKATLTPYHPNAPRSRLPVHFTDEAKPYRRFCKPRNEHSYDIFNQPTGPGFVRFKTSSQNFFGQDTSSMAVGESNQGIVSDKSKSIHAAQAK